MGAFDAELQDARAWNLKRIEELSRFHAERPSEAQDIHERNVSLTSFDPADVISVQVGKFSEFLLGELPFETEPANAISENNSRVSGRHTAII